MREYLLWAIVLGLAVYAWRDWFASACVLVVLSAFAKHPEMPRTVGGIPGANPWNLLFVCVVVAWLVTRKPNPVWRSCRKFMTSVSALYALLLVVAYLRGAMDFSDSIPAKQGLLPSSQVGFLLEYLLNPVKYLVLAVLVFDGARTRNRLLLAYGAIITQVLLFTLMTLRYIPLESLFMPAATHDNESAYRYRFQKAIGFHANDLALVLAAGFWTIIASFPLLKHWRWWWKAGAAGASGLVALATLMTNSRGGYMALVCVGVVFGVLRYRWLLVAIPVCAGIALMVFPNVADRVRFGIGDMDVSGEQVQNWDSISAGRMTSLWPYMFDEIGNAPLLGQGRMTIWRSSIYGRIPGCPGHPHNAYIEMLLDGGAVGLVVTLLLFVGFPVLAYAKRCDDNGLLTTVLYAGLTGATTILVMSLSGQSFWPREAVDTILYLYALMMAGCICGMQQRAKVIGQPLYTTGRPAHVTTIGAGLRTR